VSFQTVDITILDVTIVVEKDDLSSPQFVATGGKCRNETATFALDGKLAKIKTLAVWLTQMRADSTPVVEYERQADITVGPGGEFSLVLPVNALLTITSREGHRHGGIHRECRSRHVPPARTAELWRHLLCICQRRRSTLGRRGGSWSSTPGLPTKTTLTKL
jgi:hypothetical protein